MNKNHLLLLLAVWLAASCQSVSEFGKPERRSVAAEFHQKVGLYVHEETDQIAYYGSAATDISDLMLYHLQTTLPSLAQEALQEVFDQVEMAQVGKEAEPKITFGTPDLAGYFEIKILKIRYDYPEDDLSSYRAEVQLSVEFKTLTHDKVWSDVFEGHGLGFASADLRLTDFGRGSAAALEEAFQEAVDEVEDGVVKAPALREYLRTRQASY